MRFEEKGDFLTFDRNDKCYIYFLIQGDQVVYVGQTSVGLSRPFSHSDKEYDWIKVMPCESERLDEIEDFYICKYKPKYNKSRNHGVVYSLNKVKSLIRKYYKPNFNLWELRKIFSELNIIPFCDEYTGGSCITADQYREIEAFIKGGLTK
jgi:hypothetical protein